jgi:molybdopterin molybdotransferase
VALMPVAEALARVLAEAKPLAQELAPLADAHGRVLAGDLVALRTQPPADVSAMDGYAVHAADVARAGAAALVGEVAAGHPFTGRWYGEAARIFTGGVLPPGADTIVIGKYDARCRCGDRQPDERPGTIRRAVSPPPARAAARPAPQRSRPRARGRHEP